MLNYYYYYYNKLNMIWYTYWYDIKKLIYNLIALNNQFISIIN